MKINKKFAVVIPVANEESNILDFSIELVKQLKKIKIDYKIYFVVDRVSEDNTLDILNKISQKDKKIITIFEPKNKSVVDAYVRGFKQAIKDNNDYIIEMDAGFSHQPRELVKFVKKLEKGFDCVFGIRPLWSIKYKISFKRRLFSLGGTILSNLLLGTKLPDMTSGFEAFDATVLSQIIKKPLLSSGHFFQTEIKYRSKSYNFSTVEIHYSFPSNSVSKKSIKNSFTVLATLFVERFKFKKIKNKNP